MTISMQSQVRTVRLLKGNAGIYCNSFISKRTRTRVNFESRDKMSKSTISSDSRLRREKNKLQIFDELSNIIDFIRVYNTILEIICDLRVGSV